MLKKVIFGIILLMSSNLFAESSGTTVLCRFKNISNGNIDVTIPVNNLFFWGAKKQMALDSNGECKIKLTDSQLGVLIFYGFNNGFQLYVQKGDNIVVDVDTSLNTPVSFKGSYAKGQALLNDVFKNKWIYKLQQIFEKDSTVSIMGSHFKKEIFTTIQNFKQLYSDKEINANFLKFASDDINYLYATGMSRVLYQKYSYSSQKKDSHGRKMIFSVELQKYWDQLLKDYPVDNINGFKFPVFQQYAEYYVKNYLCDYKKGDNQQDLNVIDKIVDTRDKNLNFYFEQIRKHFSNKVEVHIEARFLYSILNEKKFDTILVSEFKKFGSKYPQNEYISLLSPLINEVVKFNAESAGLSGLENIVTDYSTMNTFSEVKSRFKGRNLYIDFWATWCGPCREEFAYKDKLKKFLDQKGVEMVYISMDVNSDDGYWKKMIHYYGLSGFHLRTNDSLRNDLMKLFWNGSSYSIPKYIIVDNGGNVVEKEALRPSDKEMLYQQIATFIK